MRTRTVVIVVGLLAMGLTAATASAQDDQAARGVTSKGLVTSLGGFSATTGRPVFVTGATVTLPPGGETGRQQFGVPTYIYVIEGILTTDYEAGPVGIKGAQYHGAGQSFMDNGGWWHNHANRSAQPVKYLMLHLGYPGRPDPVQKAAKED